MITPHYIKSMYTYDSLASHQNECVVDDPDMRFLDGDS